MPTIRQAKLAKALIENVQKDKPLNKQELVASVGYTEKSADKKATEIIGSKGVKEELKALGFDVETAQKVVGSILQDEKKAPKDRLRAADMVFKVHGKYVPDGSVTNNVMIVTDEQLRTLAERAIARGGNSPS